MKTPTQLTDTLEANAVKIADAMEMGHVLIIANPGVGYVGSIRRAVPLWAERHPMDRATRWRLGVAYWNALGGPFVDARSLPGFTDRFPLKSPPIRMPHHTVSAAGMMGSARPQRPGEIALAHGGVLVLDEWPEFSRAPMEAVLEAMRTGTVAAFGGGAIVEWPAPARVIATAHPCPCGFLGHPTRACIDGEASVARYQSRIDIFRKRPNVTTIDLR